MTGLDRECNVPRVMSKRPAECSDAELGSFEHFARRGGQVAFRGLRQRIRAAEWLVFLYEGDGILAAVAALKRPNESYRRKVFESAKTLVNPSDFEYELGWVYVEPRFRGRRYSRLLVESALALAPTANVYATTREDNGWMRQTNSRCGFEEAGNPYLSDDGDHKLVLYLRRKGPVESSRN